MNSLQLHKKELFILALVLALLPVTGFVFGLNFISNELQQTNASSEVVSNTPVVEPIFVSPVISTKEIKSNELYKKSSLVDHALRFDVQANVFADFNNATAFKRTLNDIGIEANIAFGSFINKERVYRIVVASFDTKQKAQDYIRLLQEDVELELFIKTINLKNELVIAAI